MNEKDLLRVKEEIDSAKTELAELSGEKKHLMQELKDNWGCETLEEGQKLLIKMEEDIDKLDQEIKQGLVEIEREYNNNREQV